MMALYICKRLFVWAIFVFCSKLLIWGKLWPLVEVFIESSLQNFVNTLTQKNWVYNWVTQLKLVSPGYQFKMKEKCEETIYHLSPHAFHVS